MKSNKDLVKEISLNRFNLLVLNSRHPNIRLIAFEIEYYANFNDTILGVILFDHYDKDFNCIILCRDENNRFRAFNPEVEGTSLANISMARKWIKRKILDYTRNKIEIVEQGDNLKGVELFTDVTSPSNMHPYYILLRDHISKYPAKRAIIEIGNHFTDIDGNFVDQFQSKNGFDSRLWEIYLFAFLTEEGFLFDRSHHRPDFIVTKGEAVIGIEAVIVARPSGNPPTIDPTEIQHKTLEEINAEISNDMPLRFGSSLYSKMRMKYWEDTHLSGKPLILAIADFHADQSMLWSFSALVNYLYGLNYKAKYDEKGNLEIVPEKIEPYTKPSGEKIDSGFFFTPDSENISAILFSSTATVSKFSRMGIQAGFGIEGHTVLRVGAKVDHNPNASVPIAFGYIVDENCEESWGEGVNLFHNPNAIHKIDFELFPNIAHHHLKDEHIHSISPDFHPYFSINQIFYPED
ncbi:hypothetical protein D3C87_44970 [compost metagenome]